jgi:hypothetical protein
VLPGTHPQATRLQHHVWSCLSCKALAEKASEPTCWHTYIHSGPLVCMGRVHLFTTTRPPPSYCCSCCCSTCCCTSCCC